MERRFVLVYLKGTGNFKETEFLLLENEKQVLYKINYLENFEEDIEVSKVFTIDNRGDVEHYKLAVKNFKITLEKV